MRHQRVQQLERSADVVAPALVAQLHGDAVSAERAKKPIEVVARLRRVLEARGELREQRPELAARGQRIDPPAEFIEVRFVRPNQHLNEVVIFHARRLRASRRLKAVAR